MHVISLTQIIMDGHYIVLDSSAFKDRYDENNGFSFTNQLLPPIDNFNYDLELALVEIYVYGDETPKYTTMNVSCDLVEKYQYGDGTCQHLRSFYQYSYDTVAARSGPTADNLYQFWGGLHYYRMQRNVFNQVKIDLKPMHPIDLADQPIDIKRLLLRLHIRKTTSREVANTFIK